MRFQAIVELGGKTATGIRVPEEVVVGLGPKKRVPVVVTINQYTYRSTIAAYNGAFMLPVSAENREGAGVVAGDEVQIDVEVDDQPREVEVPADFAKALAKDKAAKAFFERLSFSNKKRFVTSIEGAKTAETRQRRIDKSVATLHEGRV